MSVELNFCNRCGGRLETRLPPGEHLPRRVCADCGAVHYQNPKIVAGTLPVRDGKVLLCRRAIQPRYGWWTLPAGYMENNETVQHAAARETLEEAGARVAIRSLYTLFNLPHASQVYMIFLADLLHEDFAPGPESLEARLFSEAEIPWDEIAFATIRETLRLYFDERRSGCTSVHLGDIVRPEGVSDSRLSVLGWHHPHRLLA